jgi:hypothetical protein
MDDESLDGRIYRRHISLFQSSSTSRFTASASPFLILGQSDERPER